MKKTIVILLFFALCLMLASCGLNQDSEQAKDPFERFAWGTKRDDVYDSLVSLGVDYETSDGGAVAYEVKNFCGISGLEAPECMYIFDDEDALESISIGGLTDGNEQTNQLIEEIKLIYGTPVEEEDGTDRGIRHFGFVWEDNDSKITFFGGSTYYLMYIKPKTAEDK